MRVQPLRPIRIMIPPRYLDGRTFRIGGHNHLIDVY